MIQLVWPHKQPATLLLDDGSTCSFCLSTTLFLNDVCTCSIITHKLAGFLGLVGKPTTEFIEVAGKDLQDDAKRQ